jgi:hypothetical protein
MFKIGLENNTEGRSQAWVLAHPGCFAYGSNDSQALQAVPQAILDYQAWISAHTSESWFSSLGLDYQLEETWDCYTINDAYELAQEGYEVNAWFRHDWNPLSSDDIQRGLLLLSWGRQELLKVIGGLKTDVLERSYSGERWSISGILKHIGGAEWWYMDRLGLAFHRSDVPEDPFQRLEKVRTHLESVLPGLVGNIQVIGASGEFWSSRKLLRRAVWHEYDHIAHIKKLL